MDVSGINGAGSVQNVANLNQSAVTSANDEAAEAVQGPNDGDGDTDDLRVVPGKGDNVNAVA